MQSSPRSLLKSKGVWRRLRLQGRSAVAVSHRGPSRPGSHCCNRRSHRSHRRRGYSSGAINERATWRPPHDRTVAHHEATEVKTTITIGIRGAGLTGTLRLTWVRDLAHVTEHAATDEPTGTWTGLACPDHGLPIGSNADMKVLRNLTIAGEIADLFWEAPGTWPRSITTAIRPRYARTRPSTPSSLSTSGARCKQSGHELGPPTAQRSNSCNVLAWPRSRRSSRSAGLSRHSSTTVARTASRAPTSTTL